MVFIGKISYSLYLFHWLFIAFVYYLTNEKQLSNSVIAIVAIFSFVCSCLSYYCLENPIRRSKLTFKRSFIYLYLLPSLALISFNLLTKSYITKRENQLKQTLVMNVESDLSLPTKVLLIGDSHAGHLDEFMKYVGHKEGWRADIWPSNDMGCDFIVDSHNQFKNTPECVALRKKIEEYPIIIYSFYYNLKIGDVPVARPVGQDKSQENFKIEFINTLKEVSKTKKVYVMADNFSVTRSPISALILKHYGIDKFLKPIEVFGDVNKTNAQLWAFIQQQVPSVKWIDAQKYLHNQIYINDIPLLSDQDHFTSFGSQYMGIEFNKHERILTTEEVKALYQ